MRNEIYLQFIIFNLVIICRSQTPQISENQNLQRNIQAMPFEVFGKGQKGGNLRIPTYTTTTVNPYTEFDVTNLLDPNRTYTQDELDDLTSEAYASLTNGTDPWDDEELFPDPANMTWDRLLHNMSHTPRDVEKKINHIQTPDHKLKSCYIIGVTAKNALPDIKKYYGLRRSFTKTLPYEIGFVVETIINRYQIAIELYHLIMMKYGRVRFRYYTTVGYMLYMYSNILQQCQTVIHMCNMLHELEPKYAKRIVATDKPFESREEIKTIEQYKKYLVAYNKREKKRQKLQNKKLYYEKRYKRPERPRKGPLPLHYGWSIENW